MKNKIQILLIWPVLVAAGTVRGQEKANAHPHLHTTAMPVAGQSERKDIPFELQNGYLIVVRGSIGKLKNLSFVVDTGSSRTIVDERIARKLHLSHLGSVEQLAPGHALEMRRTIVEELSWAGRTFKA